VREEKEEDEVERKKYADGIHWAKMRGMMGLVPSARLR
jgi:hypothetical protein